jgi:polyadenylate-binding protein
VPDGAEDTFNNLFVKNLPSEFLEEDLRKVFEAFGPLISVKLDESKAFGFVAFKNCNDARTALAHFTKVHESDQQSGLYVTKCQKKEDRLKMLKKATLKYMKDLARFNLYFKGFPTDGTLSIEDLSQELKTFFGKFGDVKSLKLM